MPILGRSGESVMTRLFGNAGVGQGIKNLLSGQTTLLGRLKQGLSTAGGFLGESIKKATPTAEASEYSYQNPNSDEETEQLKKGGSGSVMPNIFGSKGYDESYNKRKQEEQLRSSIASGWDDTDDYTKSAGKALSSMSGSISGLGKARDAYIKANEENLSKKNEAIAGNRELIQKNQRTDLENLANDVRNNIFNTNLSLGVLGAADSSASGAAAKALQKSAGKNRQGVLTGYGDQISEQNQEEKKAVETYNFQREEAYKWEDQQKKIAEAEYKLNKEVYDKLKNKVPDWKKDDIEDMNDENLMKYLSKIGEITASAKAFRDTLNSWVTAMTGSAGALKAANIDINKPAELDTPEFSDELEIGEDEEQEEDYYNPNTKIKRRQYGNDLLGNPLVFEEE